MKTIGKLAQSLNLNVETIRFYEREGLITQPENQYLVIDNMTKQ